MVSRFADLQDNMPEDYIKQRLPTFASDELKAEFLENCLKKKLSSDVSKNVHIMLADLYEKKRWYGNAVANMSAAISCTDIYREKIAFNMRLGQLNVRDNKHIFARDAFKTAMDYANSEDKKKLSNDIKNFYINEGKSLEEKGKWTNAVSIYEYSLDLLGESERKGIKQKLIALYEKLGRIKDMMRMKKEL